jgi:hypothetical protein
MSKIYPKNLKNLEKLSFYFGQAYGNELATIIAREPQYTYMAYLTQTGTDVPVPQVLFSNLETLPVFTYDGIGIYKVLHPMVDFTKCILSISAGQVLSPDSYRAVAYVRGQGEVSITTVDATSNPADDQLSNTMFKMEIWL